MLGENSTQFEGKAVTNAGITAVESQERKPNKTRFQSRGVPGV